MKRYFYNGNIKDMEKTAADVVIVGSGVAGLYTALGLDGRLQCIVLNKLGTQRSNSMYAQGGIAAVVEGNGQNDDTQQHFEDTVTAGAGLCDEKAVRVLVSEAESVIRSLIRLGVPFDTADGRFQLTREGGHGKNRILHCGGDATGLHLTRSLLEEAKRRPNIRFLDQMFLTDILTGADGAVGVLAMDPQGSRLHIAAAHVVIASGGIGRVYRNSTNASCATGDGIAAAGRAGAILRDMEFVQFHPTALIHPDSNGRFFLISEALRGEGAVLRNRRWESFMQGVHPLADLAPRDIVSRAIIREMKKHDLPHVYLDITSRPRAFLKARFPTIYDECMQRDIDIAIDWIPVMPVQHYFMGGIATDIEGRTDVPGLYACGESASTGVHGANRLASNSLLECLVFGRRSAQHIGGSGRTAGLPDYEPAKRETVKELDFDSYSTEIRELMTRKCSIIRNEKELLEARRRVAALMDLLDGVRLTTWKGMETFNIASNALSTLDASIRRKESVGAHYRSDATAKGERMP